MFNSNFSFSQSCDQLEILFTEPDCFRHKQGSPVGSNGDNDCLAVSACVNQPYDYSSSITGMGYTYNWVASGPAAVTFIPNSSSPQIKIVWPVIGDYSLTLTVTDNMGNTFTKCLAVSVKEKPVAAFTFSPTSNLCAGSVVQFTNGSTFSGGMIYSWDFDDPTSTSNYSTSLNPTHQFNNPGTYDVTLVVSSFALVLVPGGTQGQGEEFVQKVCCSDTIVHTVKIDPGVMKIECVTTMCANETATYTAVGCASPTWSVPIGGSIISTVGNQITVQWGNGALQGQLSATCGPNSCVTTVQVPIIPAVPVPVGNLSPCLNAPESYSLPVLPGTFYTWRLFKQPGNVNVSANIYTFPDNNTAWINWLNVTGGVYTPGDTYQLFIRLENLHNCCGPITNFITITPKETFTAFSDQTICLGGSASLATFPAYGSFSWSVLPTTGVIPSSGLSSSFFPTFSTSGNYVATVSEVANSYCNSPTPQSVKITVLTATPAPGTIVGPGTVCLNDILAYSMSSPAPSGYHYTWTIPLGAGTFEPGALFTTTGDAVNVQWTAVSGQISVVLERNSAPLCASSATTKNVTLATTGSVTGPANVCVDSNAGYTLTGGTVPAGTTVTWSVTPAGTGTIIAGQGTTNVTIKWHGTGGPGTWAGTVNASTTCGVATSFNVTIYPKFTFTLSQSSDICQPSGTILTASAVAYSPTYLWSGGSTTNPTSVFNAGTYQLLVTNAGGCTATNTIDVIDPFIVRGACTVGTCNAMGMQELLSISANAPGAITYQWFTGTSSSGSPILGQTGPTYTATTGGNYYVEAYYGTCTKFIQYNIKQVCCPDVNRPAISFVQNTCRDFTFTHSSLVPGKPYILYFGDNTSVSGTTTGSNIITTHQYPPTAGIYCVKLEIDNGLCGVNWASTSVIVPIKANFFYQMPCTGCPVITNTSINLGGGTATYDWDFGDGFTSIGNTSPIPPTHCYTVAGNYNIVLTMNYVSGAITCSDVFSLPISYAPLSIGVTPSPVCTDNLVTFTTINGSAWLVTYNWDFGDGSFAFTNSSVHSYSVASPPNYNVTLSVTDILGNVCNVASSVNVLPGFSATLAPGYICPGGSATLSPTVNGPVGVYTYAWEELLGVNWVPAAGANTGATYTTAVPGTFHVIITAPNGCIVTTNLVPVINVPKPVAKISVSPSKKLCTPGGFITFTSDNHLTGYTSDWYEGSISLANHLNPGAGQNLSSTFSYTVSASNNYYLVLTNQYGCKDICQIFIEVNAPPAVPVISPFGVICEGVPTVLSIPATTNNILWNTGQNTNSITVFKAGVYSVVVNDPLTGCSSSTQKVVSSRPNVDLFPHFCQKVDCECKVPFAIYAPKPLVGLLAPSPAYTVAWYNSPSNTLITTGITGGGLIYDNSMAGGVQAGSYYIVMTDPATGCTNTSEIYTVLPPVPTVAECKSCSCDGGSWGTVTLSTTSPISTIVIPCPTINPVSVGCVNPYVLNGNYNCSTPGCVSEIRYVITPPSGPTVSGVLPYTFTPVIGFYSVVLTAFCNGIECGKCEFRINACPPLEVNLISFTAKKIQNKVEINWNTASEISNSHYILERSADGNGFSTLAKINSKNGNSKEELNYNYIDEFPLAGINYYRLKAIDFEGKPSLSKIVALDFEDTKQPILYPNPTKNSNITLDMNLIMDGNIKLEILDVLGRTLRSNEIKGYKGQNKVDVILEDLPSGKYFMKITSGINFGTVNVLSFEK